MGPEYSMVPTPKRMSSRPSSSTSKNLTQDSVSADICGPGSSLSFFVLLNTQLEVNYSFISTLLYWIVFNVNQT